MSPRRPLTFVPVLTPEEIRREKARARALRATAWWRRRVQRGVCGYCGRPTPPRELTMDHRIPLVRGGRSVRANLVPACRACNAAKKYLLPSEWDAYLAQRQGSREGDAGAGRGTPAASR